ncbi:Bug family tripartite tricarboxylate transporter substrate binding protein [Siccirubricoccus phaeus]|uniref:Bug family tripartite tricarboxylate transporter substrate binding protein n=1 Tax=Siccirubricoccus phaeus TaxID=2595053 RepID=UPI0011F3A056|nr:tripartite tricarboxylate transporter substrate-binding protein [Siccirubricoccus phaeus]
MPRAMRLGRRAMLALALATPALAQAPLPWPARGIRLVVPFGPGGPTDIMARALSHGLTPALGQPVVVENRPGGGGNIGVAHVGRAAPDGYTLLVTSTGFVVNPSLFRSPGYDPFRDFAPITELGASPNVLLARPDSGIESVAALVERAKAAPGVLNMANPGIGSTPHLTAELLRLKTGIEVVQVPHNSAALAVQSLLGGTTSIGVTALPPAQPQIKAGALRALALTGAHRWPDLPEVPTMQELGYEGFISETFQGLLAPSGTPSAILARLATAARAVLTAPQMAARLRAAGFELRLAGPEALADRIAHEAPMWQEVIRAAGLPQE